jgi:hypothetical protein
MLEYTAEPTALSFQTIGIVNPIHFLIFDVLKD